MSSSGSNETETEPTARSDRRSIIFGAMGTVVEWYDFVVYAYLAAIISPLFFPTESDAASLVATFGVFAAGYAMRPLGGLFFGNLGDRVGRRKTLLLSITMMTIPMVVMGFLPTYDDIGIWAPILLTLVRLIQGFSVGGEYTGVLTLLLEDAPRERRGLVTAFGAFTSGGGSVLAALVVLAMTATLTAEQESDWGWRAAYWLGAAMAVTVLVLRTMVRETPQFEELKKRHELVKLPIIHAIREYPGRILVAFAVTGYMGICTYYVMYFPTYAQTEGGIENWQTLIVMTIVAAFFSFTAPAFGALSDRVGRRPMLLGSTCVFPIIAVPVFLLIREGNFWLLLLGSFLFVLPVTAFTGAFVSAVGELFPTRERYSGLAIGYNFGSAALGGTAALVAQSLVTATGNSLAPSWYVIVASLVIIPIIWRMKETARVPMSQIGLKDK
ncbi:MAG: MFS transporter [Pseudomonadota bacterium]